MQMIGERTLRTYEEYRRTVYLDLLMSGKLNGYLAGIEEQAQERFERIIEQMRQARGITEQLKAAWWEQAKNSLLSTLQ